MLDSTTIDRPKRRKLRGYSTEFKVRAVALAEHAQNGTIAAEALNIPRTTLNFWRNHPELNDQLEKAIVERDVIQALEAMTWRCIDAMPEKLADASLSQIAHALSVTIDKAQLLRGQPTSISQSSTLTRDQALDRIRQAIQANAIDVLPEEERAGEGVQAIGSPGRDTVERETSGLLSEKEKEVEVTQEGFGGVT